MNDLKQLALALRELDDDLVTCMRCGMCQAVCPVYAETMSESDVARGKIVLLNGLAEALLDNPQKVQDRLNHCLLCGSCEHNCPSGVNTTAIFLKARSILSRYLGLSTAERLVFKKILNNPARFERLLSLGEKLQSVVITPADELLGTSCSRILTPVLGNRHFKKLAATPFHRQVPVEDIPETGSGLTVALFYGCVTDSVYPEIGHACLKALKHHGVGVQTPVPQVCCGIPALSAGDVESFADMVAKNVGLFSAKPFDYLVTPCATCTATIRTIWPALTDDLAPETAERACAIAEKTVDISQFLADHCNVTPETTPEPSAERVTYHDPCHLAKTLGVRQQPRSLLRANGTHKLVEMDESDSCCGNGGSFNLHHYERSRSIAEKKRSHVVATGCETVATSCPACMLQLADVLSQNHDKVKVQHVIELYASTLPDAE